MSGTKINATDIAKPYREQVRERVQQLKQSGIEAPLLVGLLANKDPAAKKYAEWTGKACQADGLRYELRELADPIDVEGALNEANNDPNVHGIIVYYPIFGQQESFSGTSQDDYLRDSISVKKDVEGLCYQYRRNLYANVRYLDYPYNSKKCLLPCTALSVVKILEKCPGCYDKVNKPVGKQLEGKVVTIINRSEIVGRPLAAMLANDGASVYSVDISSIYLFQGGRLHKVDEDETAESCVRKSSIVVTGVPTKSYKLPTEWVNPNTTVVNVASFKNVDEEALLKLENVTYVSMVGKVTVAMLERNVVRLFDNFHHPDRRIKSLQEDEQVRSGNATAGNEKKEGLAFVQLYTAVVATAILAFLVAKK
jgi:methylenetetrahydrofolate dehydrogenase (NAD+)